MLILRRLFYISISTSARCDRDGSLADICEVARARNIALGLTGALLYSGDHFAQVLEGPSGAVDEVMASILRDPRHRNVAILSDKQVADRQYSRWALAFARPSAFVQGQVCAALREQEGQSAKAETLERFMIGMIDD